MVNPFRVEIDSYFSDYHRKYKCNDGRSLNKQIRHKNVKYSVHPKRYKCALCEYSCDRRSTLKRHLKIHVKAYQCPRCLVRFSQKRVLRQHFCTPIRDGMELEAKLVSNEMKAEQKELDSVQDIVIPFVCKTCSFACTDRSLFFQHLAVHSIPKLGTSGKYKCKHCSKFFVRFSDMLKHERIHDSHLSKN